MKRKDNLRVIEADARVTNVFMGAGRFLDLFGMSYCALGRLVCIVGLFSTSFISLPRMLVY